MKTDKNVQAIPLYSQSDKRVGFIYTDTTINISYRGVALSNLENTKLSISEAYNPVYLAHFGKRVSEIKPKEFIRSAAVDIKISSGTVYKSGTSNIKLNLETDSIVSNTSFDRYKRKVS